MLASDIKKYELEITANCNAQCPLCARTEMNMPLKGNAEISLQDIMRIFKTEQSIEGKEFKFSLPSTHNSFIYLINGEIEIGEQKHAKVKDSTLVLLSRGENLKVSAKINAKFLVISGKPINEEIARGGPFVMNTKSEILQAVQDYHSGNFVK